MPADFDEIEFGSRRPVRSTAADALFRRPRRTAAEDPGPNDLSAGPVVEAAAAPGPKKRKTAKRRSQSTKPSKKKLSKKKRGRVTGTKLREHRPDPAPAPTPGEGVLVPLDQWTKVMNQLGNLHEAGQQIAEARERAARAETEAAFLRERLKEMRTELEVERRTRRPDPGPEPHPPSHRESGAGGPPAT